MYKDMCPSLWYHIEDFHCPKSLCAPLFIPPHPSLIFFTVSIVLPSPECHIVGIIQYVAFSDWLLSLNNSPLRLLHVFSWLDSLFLLSAKYYSIVWMHCSLIIHSPTEGHLGCFQVLAITKKLAINICVQIFVWTWVVSSIG